MIKIKPLSHTTKNTDRTMHFSNKTKCYLFTAMPMLLSSIGDGKEYRFNHVINALALDRYVAW